MGLPAERARVKEEDSRPLVLHLHTLPWIAGSGLNTFYSMKYLDPKRYRTALACRPGGPLEELVKKSGFAFHPIRHFRSEVSPYHDLAALVEVKRLLNSLRPALLHTHNSKAGFLGRLAARKLPRLKVVHTVHGFAFHSRETPLRRALFRFLERRAFPWADASIVISPALAAWAERAGIAPRTTFRVIWSGIEIESFRNADREAGRQALGLSPETVAVGLVAKLWEGKGHEFLLRVLEQDLGADLKLVFVGTGPLEEYLRRIAGPNVIFTGHRDDIPRITAALDLSVLPSDFEGMGRVLLEAQAAGVPVLANRLGGMVDVVADPDWLLPPRDEVAWRETIRRLVRDPDERRRRGEKGRAFVTERFSAKTMGKQIENIYDEVLGRKVSKNNHGTSTSFVPSVGDKV
ncbi:MAG: glycosyltransferase family 1 protein [Candidatus Hydrogenedentota bacterium]|nr:MAG: glycosyltransferase family 1 protein [Candidatus Hydrogenedentota bacterium]